MEILKCISITQMSGGALDYFTKKKAHKSPKLQQKIQNPRYTHKQPAINNLTAN